MFLCICSPPSQKFVITVQNHSILGHPSSSTSDVALTYAQQNMSLYKALGRLREREREKIKLQIVAVHAAF